MWQAPPAAAPYPNEWLPALDLPAPGPQNRLTVLFRLLLLIPQFIVVWVLTVVAFVVTVIGWFGALVLGRLPVFAADYLGAYVPYETRVNAYLLMTTGSYPPFAFRVPDYPVQVGLRPGELNRLAVLFRIVLVIPAAVVQGLLYAGWWVVGWISWLVVLVLGRMPQPLFEASAAVLRYRMRYMAYLLMLTSAYPKRLFGDEPGSEPEGTVSATRPLVMSGAGRGLLVLFLVLGLASGVTSSVTTTVTEDDDEVKNVTGPLLPGPLPPGPSSG
ncbi:DUF4389 domain-containing protein [Kitasatospora purpeofusca]|uniref:DUF4389 domain-containing protein n=1 Tax=Kitasatospora purpeofusca TaxID=67352 RepID=UPI002A5A75A8|nr:DUF4389 domain-containing protein [Kitasatospora purpeofusca]MDY0814686.1 DUF4389 domain-containing protein [Kitasatospora purpeofusca]